MFGRDKSECLQLGDLVDQLKGCNNARQLFTWVIKAV